MLSARYAAANVSPEVIGKFRVCGNGGAAHAVHCALAAALSESFRALTVVWLHACPLQGLDLSFRKVQRGIVILIRAFEIQGWYFVTPLKSFRPAAALSSAAPLASQALAAMLARDINSEASDHDIGR